jgi:hypothetical protein
LAVRVDDPERRWYVAVGGRFPVANDKERNAANLGIRTDYDRFEAFVYDWLPFNIRLWGKASDWDGVAVTGFIGPSILVPFGDNESEETEILLDYGFQLWLDSEMARMGGGFTGRYYLTCDKDCGFADVTIHQFGFAANFGKGAFRPGFHIRVPLDNDLAYQGVRYVFGVTLSIVDIE